VHYNKQRALSRYKLSPSLVLHAQHIELTKRQCLQIRLWILKFENLFICHLWDNSNTRWECSRLSRNEKRKR